MSKNLTSLTVGAGDSGKSTVIKQMRIIHHGGFKHEERKFWKNIIFHNLKDSLLDIFHIMQSQNTDVEVFPGNMTHFPCVNYS
jgi:hypothetical protein